MASDKPGWFAELKHRNVLRAAVLYAGAVWAFGQGLSQFSPALGLPDYATRWFLIAAAIGFPFWLAFAWFYEFTPQGIKRESEVAPSASITHSTARKLDFAIIGVMAVAIALLTSGYFVRRNAPATAAFNPPTDTIVVLPFANLSGDKSQQYFSDGITEELTNALGQNTALRVIAWDTASHYRDRTQPATAVGKALDVANVLTGKILREGNTVRVIVELVNARTGYQVWSDHYDDSLANVFQVQDRISAAIAEALNVKFASLGPARTVNPAAHDLVLQARALMDKAHSAGPLEQARVLLEQAVAIDPDYADAHALLASAWSNLTEFSTLSWQDALPHIQEEAHKALSLDPRNITAQLALVGTVESYAEVMSEYKRILEIAPGSIDAHVDYGFMLPPGPGLVQFLEALRRDPDNESALAGAATSELNLGEYKKALVPLQAMMRLDPHSTDAVLGLALTYSFMHRNEDAVKALDLARPDTPLAKALIAASRLAYQSALDPKLHAQALAALEALRQRADLDPFSLGDLIQLYLALGETEPALDLMPKYCTILGGACHDLRINPEYAQLRGKPRFEALMKQVKQYNTVSKPAPAATAPSATTAAQP